ncbi:MAG: hypothetical protein LBN95_09580 [Prevotellaceae bacterium]|nr:hypothetical protein [Prevotellaceae bacterium]
MTFFDLLTILATETSTFTNHQELAKYPREWACSFVVMVVEDLSCG